MNVGELFVNLGIKGSEKTVGALSGVTKGLGEAKSMSIEAKAAILGAVYAFERMMQNSGRAGTDLTNFAALTGLSAKSLQQWQWAAMQAGDTTEDFTSSLKGVQSAVNNMLLNKSAPEYIGMITRNVKNFDPSRLRDTFYLMQKLQEAAQNMPADLGTTMLRSFGLGDPTIAAMRRNAFTPEMMAKAPTYSDGEVKQLDKANIAWSNLGNKIEMAFGHFNAKHGGQLVADISKITDQVIRLAEALEKVAEDLKIFAGISKALGFIADAVGVVGQENYFNKKKPDRKQEGALGGVLDWRDKIDSAFLQLLTSPKGNFSDAKLGTSAIAPTAPNTGTGGDTTHNSDFKQTVIFQGSHDAPKKAADSLKKAVGDFVKQNAAKVQGS